MFVKAGQPDMADSRYPGEELLHDIWILFILISMYSLDGGYSLWCKIAFVSLKNSSARS